MVQQLSDQHCDLQTRTEKGPVEVHQSSDHQLNTEQVSLVVCEMSEEEIKVHQSSDHQLSAEQVFLGVSEMSEEEIKVHQSSDQHCDHQSRTEQVSLWVSEVSKEEIKVHQSSDHHCDHQSRTEQVSLGVSEVSKEIKVHQSSDQHCDHQSTTEKVLLGVKKVSKRGYSFLKLNDTFKKLPIKVHQSSNHQSRTEKVSLGVSELSKEEIKAHQSTVQHCDNQSRTEKVSLGVSEVSKGETCNLFGKEGILWDSGQRSSQSAVGMERPLSKGQKKKLRRKKKKLMKQRSISSVLTTENKEGSENEREESDLSILLPVCQPQAKWPREDFQKTSETAARVQNSLTKTQKRNLRRIRMRKQRSTSLVPTSEKEEESEMGRERCVPSTLLPACQPQAKRPREDFNPTSFVQNFELLQIAIVKEGFPLNKLNKDEYDLIQMEILGRIDVIPPSAFLPKIHRTNLVSGAMIILCNDMSTVSWLIEQFNYNSGIVKESTLKVLNADDLPKSLKVEFKTKDTFTKEPAVILRRLQRFNPDLKCENWHVLQRLVDPQTIRWIFEVEQESAKAIKQQGLVAFTGLHQGFFKILNDASTKEQEDAYV